MIPACVPIVGLLVCLAALAAIALAPCLRAFRRGWFVVAVVLATAYGGGKWRFTYENGVRDAGSYCTNDIIHAAWTYSPPYAQYALKAKYRDLTIKDDVGRCIDPWHDLEDGVVSMLWAEWHVPNATNMEVLCYAQYVPPPHVVTNGVYHMEGVSRSLATTNAPSPDFVIWGTRIEIVLPNGEIKVLTPTNRPPDPVFNRSNQGESNE